MAVENISLEELKHMAPSLKKDSGQAHGFHYAPMFLPIDATAKKGTGVVKVVTRQSFLTDNINHWVKWKAYQGTAIGLGVAALALLGTNVMLSGAAALGAGYFYGQYRRKDFIINNLLKTRWLLEGT